MKIDKKIEVANKIAMLALDLTEEQRQRILGYMDGMRVGSEMEKAVKKANEELAVTVA